MRQLSLDALRIFVTIVQKGSFTRAGDILGRSQPAISLQMKKLEEQLNKKLFIKQGQSLIPSKEGKWLHKHALQMLQINDDIFHFMQDESLSGKIKLGIPSEFASLLLPSLINEFATQHPDISLEVASELSHALLRNRTTEQYDLVLALTETKNNDAMASHWVKDQIVWVGDKNHPPQPNNLALVLAGEGCVYRTRVINTLKQQTVPWRVTYTNSDVGGLSTAIAQGLGITALAKRTVPKNLHILKHKSLPELGQIHVGLFPRESLTQSKRQKIIIDTLTQFLFRKLMSE